MFNRDVEESGCWKQLKIGVYNWFSWLYLDKVPGAFCVVCLVLQAWGILRYNFIE